MSPSGAIARSWGEYVRPLSRVRIGIIAVLLMAIYWDTIRHSIVVKWIHDDDWSHGWLIPVFSIYFLITRRHRLFVCDPKPSYLGAVILAGSLLCFFLAPRVFPSAYPQALTLVGAVFGITLLLGGWNVMRVAWFPILFLLLAIPIPERIYVALTTPQQAFASSAAAAIMPLFAPGLYTEAQAVVIDYVIPGKPPGRLNVEEACSGMRMMMAFVTLGVAMAYLGERPAWQRLTMIVGCIPIAILCNAVRVTVTGLLYIYGYDRLAKGIPHQLLGIAMLVIAIGLYSVLGYVFSHLFIDDPDEVQATS